MNLRAHPNADSSFTLICDDREFLDIRFRFGGWQVSSKETDTDYDNDYWRRVLTGLAADRLGINYQQDRVSLADILADVREVLILRAAREDEQALDLLDERAEAFFMHHDAIENRVGA